MKPQRHLKKFFALYSSRFTACLSPHSPVSQEAALWVLHPGGFFWLLPGLWGGLGRGLEGGRRQSPILGRLHRSVVSASPGCNSPSASSLQDIALVLWLPAPRSSLCKKPLHETLKIIRNGVYWAFLEGTLTEDFPRSPSVKEPTCQCRRRKWSQGQEYPLEERMATHSSILAWRIPWTEEPGGLQSTRSQRDRQDWSNLACTSHHWRCCSDRLGQCILCEVPTDRFLSWFGTKIKMHHLSRSRSETNHASLLALAAEKRRVKCNAHSWKHFWLECLSLLPFHSLDFLILLLTTCSA